MARILIADEVAPDCAAILRREGHEVEIRAGAGPEELRERIAAFDALVVRSRTRVTAGILEAGKRLRLVGRAGIGTDNIDVEAATRRGVIVMNTPQANVTAAAEHTMALVLSLARNVPQAHAHLRAGGWDRERFTGVELEGKVLGVVGLGRIGSRVARLAQSFGMKVLASDPYLNVETARRLGVELVELDALLEAADFVTLHVPAGPRTRHLVDAERLARMRPGARLVNASRGGVVDEQALLRALDAGTLAGAALDVFEEEPPAPDHPLRRHPKVIVTPHLGASTEEAQLRVGREIAEQIVEFFRSGSVRNAVNLVLPDDPALEPYVQLAGQLGSLAAQLADGPVELLEVTASGDISSADTRAITTCAVLGALRFFCGEAVNLVNARVIAAERGIRVAETRVADGTAFRSEVTVRIGNAAKAHRVSGTVLEGRSPRVVNVDGYELEVRPARHMLAMVYPDVPGVVGKFGTVTGRYGVNIAHMAVGRTAPGERAFIFVTVDQPVPAAALEEIRAAIPGLEFLRSIEL